MIPWADQDSSTANQIRSMKFHVSMEKTSIINNKKNKLHFVIKTDVYLWKKRTLYIGRYINYK